MNQVNQQTIIEICDEPGARDLQVIQDLLAEHGWHLPFSLAESEYPTAELGGWLHQRNFKAYWSYTRRLLDSFDLNILQVLVETMIANPFTVAK